MADANPEDLWPELASRARRRVLILGGTGEARQLAERLARRDELTVISSLAGRTARPLRPPGRLRIGGFGGAAGLADYLRSEAIDLVVDATHPHARTISENAATACAQAGVSLRRVERLPWRREAGDDWIAARDYAEAATLIPDGCRRVLLTIGRQNLAPFAARAELRYIVRVIDPPEAPLPLPRYELVTGRGPFSEEGERTLMMAHDVDCLVTKNSGGAATAAKLAAARSLGLPVVMIAPPPAATEG